DRAGVGVYPQEALLDRVVHAVVDVSVDVHRFAYAAAVHVGFIRQDHGRGDGRDRRSLGLLVVGDGRDDRHQVGALYPVAEALIDEDPAGLPVGVAGERVPDVVQVSGDARELRLTFGEIEPVQDLVADVGDQVRVPEAVFRVTHRVHHAVRRGDIQRELGIVLDILERDARGVRWGGLRGRDLRNGRALGGSDGVGLAHDRIGPAAFSSGPSSG